MVRGVRGWRGVRGVRGRRWVRGGRGWREKEQMTNPVSVPSLMQGDESGNQLEN